MSIYFTEGRGLPKEFTRGGGYEGFGGEAVVDVMKAISPWDMLTGLFVTKPAAERAAQVAIADAQVRAQGQAQAAQSANLKTIMMYGGAAVGALVLVILLTKRRKTSVAGYRKRPRRRSRRSH